MKEWAMEEMAKILWIAILLIQKNPILQLGYFVSFHWIATRFEEKALNQLKPVCQLPDSGSTFTSQR